MRGPSLSPGRTRLPERILRLFPALAALLLIGGAAPADRCAALEGLALPGVSIDFARMEEGACRVRGVARPRPAARIAFELWLPQAGWNGRYAQHGNGGFAGNIDQPTLAADAARGYAAAATDTGHSADRFDARWAARRPDLVADYGHRSIKATSDAAQALIRAYYGLPARRRYFIGCSNGGRQALMAAQLYPEDWDGILAGAPANLWTRQLASFAALQQHLRATPGAWLPRAKLPAIQRAALASCPAGSVDSGVALRPEECGFDSSTMLCRAAESDDCLTALQAESVRRIQAAGFEPTAAAYPDNWEHWIVNPDPEAPSQLSFANGAFRYLLQDRPDWQLAAYAPDRDRIARERARLLDADRTDLSAFYRRGGRILSYFGRADALISPREGLAYYRRVAVRAGGIDRLRPFYRLFMVPGMIHCQGGIGPTSFGQSLSAPSARRDADHDIRLALEAWVERGIAPERLIAHDRAGARRSLLPMGGERPIP